MLIWLDHQNIKSYQISIIIISIIGGAVYISIIGKIIFRKFILKSKFISVCFIPLFVSNPNPNFCLIALPTQSIADNMYLFLQEQSLLTSSPAIYTTFNIKYPRVIEVLDKDLFAFVREIRSKISISFSNLITYVFLVFPIKVVYCGSSLLTFHLSNAYKVDTSVKISTTNKYESKLKSACHFPFL